MGEARRVAAASCALLDLPPRNRSSFEAWGRSFSVETADPAALKYRVHEGR
jgi:hypothetical protein